MRLFSGTPPARPQELGKALCQRHGARAARWMRTEEVGGRVEGAVAQRRVEVFALAGVMVATVGYAWEEPPATSEKNGRIVTVLASRGIDSALAAVLTFERRGSGVHPLLAPDPQPSAVPL